MVQRKQLEVFDRAQISQNIQTALAAAQKRSQELHKS
jgi:pyrroline-5-carboxylate reductase